MAIPQTLVGITDDLRVDFAVFVPMQTRGWRWLAVEIDSPETHSDLAADERRDALLSEEGYEVVHFSTETKGIEQARRFIREIRAI